MPLVFSAKLYHISLHKAIIKRKIVSEQHGIAGKFQKSLHRFPQLRASGRHLCCDSRQVCDPLRDLHAAVHKRLISARDFSIFHPRGPISKIWSRIGLSPVVSRSSATYVFHIIYLIPSTGNAK